MQHSAKLYNAIHCVNYCQQFFKQQLPIRSIVSIWTFEYTQEDPTKFSQKQYLSFSPGVFKFLFKICSLTQNRFDQKSIFSNIPDFYYLVFNKVLARDWFSIICFFSPDKTKGTTNVTHFLIFELIELWYKFENEEGL